MAITHQELLDLAFYDQNTGIFYRRKACRGHSVGSIMGTIRPDGRCSIAILGGRFLRSRLAWFYVYGVWPDLEIDHINRNCEDDRICNLRLADRSQQLVNAGLRSDNTSGYKGVSWSKKDRVWVAQILMRGKHHYLGGFHNPEAAYAAYCRASRELHGEFAIPEVQTCP